MGCEDVVEGFDQQSVRQEPLGPFGRGYLFGVEFGDAAVAMGVVVAGVQYGSAPQEAIGQRAVRGQRDGEQDHLPGAGSLLDGACVGSWPQLRDKVRQALRAARVGDYDVDIRRHRQSRDRGPNVSAADDSQSWHRFSIAAVGCGEGKRRMHPHPCRQYGGGIRIVKEVRTGGLEGAPTGHSRPLTLLYDDRIFQSPPLQRG